MTAVQLLIVKTLIRQARERMEGRVSQAGGSVAVPRSLGAQKSLYTISPGCCMPATRSRAKLHRISA